MKKFVETFQSFPPEGRRRHPSPAFIELITGLTISSKKKKKLRSVQHDLVQGGGTYMMGGVLGRRIGPGFSVESREGVQVMLH